MSPNYDLIPESTLETLKAWVESARPMGSFCEALVSNDLKQAFARADERNIAAMFHAVAWLWNNAPGACWGSPEALERWPKLLREWKGVSA